MTNSGLGILKGRLKSMARKSKRWILRLLFKMIGVTLYFDNYPLIPIKGGINLVMSSLRGGKVLIFVFREKIMLFYLSSSYQSSRFMKIGVSDFAVNHFSPKYKEGVVGQFFPLSFVESKGLTHEMYEICPLNDFERKPFNIDINPDSDHGTVFLGNIDGYFHQLLEFIPIILKYNKFRFVGESNSPSTFCNLLTFFQIPYQYHSRAQIDLGKLPLKIESMTAFCSHTFIRYPGSCYPDLMSVQILRDYILPKLIYRENVPNIYISRSLDTVSRKIRNEDFLLERLNTTSNFISFTPSLHTFQEQFELFACSNVIVAAHGAGLSNLISAQRGSLVIEINRTSDVRWHYKRISEILGLEHHLIVGANDRDDGIKLSDSSIDEICRILKERK